jgi:hypothetical protein
MMVLVAGNNNPKRRLKLRLSGHPCVAVPILPKPVAGLPLWMTPDSAMMGIGDKLTLGIWIVLPERLPIIVRDMS